MGGDPPKGESENRRHERQGWKKSQSKEHYWGHCYRQQETDSASSTHEKHLEHFPELSIWRTGVFIQPEWGLHPSGNGRNINTTALPGCTWYTGSANSLLPLLLRTYWGKCKKNRVDTTLRNTSKGRCFWIWKKRSTTASTETRGEQSECVQGPEANAATQNIEHSKKLHMKRCHRLFQRIKGNYPYPDFPQILLRASLTKVGIKIDQSRKIKSLHILYCGLNKYLIQLYLYRD